ncbi:BLUF domain-containing protein [Shimia sp. R11_0]|uniref:BLUF domain-containing protein n=1 Tax=Shimia sp. R11_0 TaxID=2821096 RepID=UPI001ADD1AA2|nr:BLUF domain-containing protein [Shimia sp. R11_0]MBO9477861.1 BLUF domain-containing protein [Shimia sp. R11_0]
MKFVIYNSLSLHPAFEAVDMEILREAFKFNATHGITGFLYRCHQHYYQYFEGAADIIDDLLPRIAKDKRHTDFQVLQVDEISSRRFTGWSMGYSRAASELQNALLSPSSSAEAVRERLTLEAQKQRATHIPPQKKM